MRISKVCIYVIVAWTYFLVSAYAEITDRVVAVVNGDAITMSELNNTLEPYMKKIEESYKGQEKEKIIAEGKQTMLNKLIDNTLIDQESKKSGIIISDSEVMDTVNDVLSRKKITIEVLRTELAKENSSLDAYKKEVKDHLMRLRLLRREIKSAIVVSEEEIGDYYLKHRDAYEGQEAVRIQQILVFYPKDVDEKIKAKLRAEMDEIHKRLQKGEAFEQLAAQHSRGPAASSGGDVGFVEKGLMIPAVETVAFRLKKDEISGVIESPVGFHIIKVIDKRGAGIKPIKSVREEIKAKIEEEKMDKKYEEWIKELRGKSLIEIRL